MSDFNKDRLISLVNRSLENEISEVEFQELSNILKSSKKAQVIYLELVDMHTALDDKSFSRLLKSKTPKKRKQKKPSVVFRVIALAALLAIAAGIIYKLKLQTFNVIVESSQNAQVKGQSIFHGQKLQTNVLEVEKGLISLKFPTGSRMVIEGPSKLRILSENSAQIYSGKIFAYVPAQGKGFSINVGTRRVIDLGTRFAIEVSGSNELHVFEGLVELQEDKNSRLELKEGKALKFSKNLYPQKIPLNRKKFSVLENFAFPSKTFHFEKDLEGWKQTEIAEFFDRGDKTENEQTKGNMRFIQSSKSVLSNEDTFGNNLCNAHKFSGRIIPVPFYARDKSMKVSILSSPPFTLRRNGGEIQAYLHGGCGALEKLSGTLEQLGTDSHENGFLGLALRRVSDNKYVASTRRKARNRPQFRKGWEKVIISQEDLNRVLDESQAGEKFVLDLVDTFSYEDAIWSWTALDTVTIPGKFIKKE